eukprot:795585_1
MAEDDNGCSSQIPSLQSLIVQPFLLPGEYWISIGQPNGIPDQMGEWTIKIICPTPSPGSTPSPTPPEPLMCFDIIEGDFNGDKLTWAFANPYTIHITWTACLSEFDTILSITNREGIVLDYCDDCGTFFEQGDCSINIGETCCDGLVPYASEIRRYVNKGQIYYFTLDVNPGNIPQYPARFSVQLICDGVTPWPSHHHQVYLPHHLGHHHQVYLLHHLGHHHQVYLPHHLGHHHQEYLHPHLGHHHLVFHLCLHGQLCIHDHLVYRVPLDQHLYHQYQPQNN